MGITAMPARETLNGLAEFMDIKPMTKMEMLAYQMRFHREEIERHNQAILDHYDAVDRENAAVAMVAMQMAVERKKTE